MNLKASAAPLPNLFLNRLGVLVSIGAATSTLLLSGVAQALPIVSAIPDAPNAADADSDSLLATALPEAQQPPLPPQSAIEPPDSNPSAPEPDASLDSIGVAAQAPVEQATPASPVLEATHAVNLAPIADQPIASDAPSEANPAAAQAALMPIAPAVPLAPTSDQALPNAPQLAQAAPSSRPTADAPEIPTSERASDLIGRPLIHVQGAYLLQGDESSARGRVTGLYVVNPNLLFGATVDLTGGNAFSDSRQEGLNLNELYVAVSPSGLPGLRIVAGLMDLTSYFDRNSFAKDALTHFFNPVFQTNPALAVSGIGSRPGLLANWSVNDSIELKAATFSSSRDLGDFALDAFAGEIGLRLGNAIIRGTYVSDRDAGQNDGFREIFQIPRSGGSGLSRNDREEAYGINAEYFIPQLRLGLFGRYGGYRNSTIDRSASTYSVGLNFLDLFLRDDRLGLAYGRQLSNDSLRRGDSSRIPDVLEFFYDVRLTPNLRAGVTLQERNEFSETIVGFRIRADFDVTGRGRRI